MDPFTVMMASFAAQGASSVLDAATESANEKHRRHNLRLEAQNAKNRALQKEADRLRELTYANADQIASKGAGNVAAFDSPSFIALRRANRQIAEKDIQRIEDDKKLELADIESQISVSKAVSRAAVFKGVLATAGTIFAAKSLATKLGGGNAPQKRAKFDLGPQAPA